MLIIKDEQGHSQVWGATTGNKHRSQFRIAQILRSLQPESHILELGCGQGDLTLALLQDGHTVTALDRSQNMIDATWKRCPDNAKLILQKCEISEYLKTTPDRYDAVVGIGILHHFAPDLTGHLALIKECLKTNGRGLFWEPNRQNPIVKFIFGTAWGRNLMLLEKTENAFTKTQLLAILNPLFPRNLVEAKDWVYPFFPATVHAPLRQIESCAPGFVKNRIAQSLWIEFYKSARLDAKTESPK